MTAVVVGELPDRLRLVIAENFGRAVADVPRSVLLSDETWAKQQRRHPDVSLACYAPLVAQLFERSLVVRDTRGPYGQRHVLFFERVEWSGQLQLVKLAVKFTADWREAYLVSLHRKDPRDYEEHGPVLRWGAKPAKRHYLPL